MNETFYRFNVGDTVWVRDCGKSGRGFAIEKATVRERHYHPGRTPWYPNGEGYTLDGELWWDCYPGCRVFATREEARTTTLEEHARKLTNLSPATPCSATSTEIDGARNE